MEWRLDSTPEEEDGGGGGGRQMGGKRRRREEHGEVRRDRREEEANLRYPGSQSLRSLIAFITSVCHYLFR